MSKLFTLSINSEVQNSKNSNFDKHKACHQKNALIEANCLTNNCEGTVTRHRIMEDGKVEKSTIDFVILSQDLEELIEKVKVDEEQIKVLTKITKHKNEKTSKTEADYNDIDTDLNVGGTKV